MFTTYLILPFTLADIETYNMHEDRLCKEKRDKLSQSPLSRQKEPKVREKIVGTHRKGTNLPINYFSIRLHEVSPRWNSKDGHKHIQGNGKNLKNPMHALAKRSV